MHQHDRARDALERQGVAAFLAQAAQKPAMVIVSIPSPEGGAEGYTVETCPSARVDRSIELSQVSFPRVVPIPPGKFPDCFRFSNSAGEDPGSAQNRSN
jgi:hypothetical protein